MNSQSPRFRLVRSHGLAGSLALTVALAVTGAACGGGSGASGTAGSSGHADAGGAGAGGGSIGVFDNTPTGQCKKFVATFCERLNQCEPPDGGIDAATVACNTDNNVAAGCDRATSAAFPTCISDVQGLSCSGLGLVPDAGFQPPSSCMTPLEITPSDAQNKCQAIVELLCDPTDACGNGILPTTDQNFVACVNEGYFDLQCSFAVSESATYDQCLTDLCTEAASEADGGTGDGGVPASCTNVIVGVM